MTMRINAEDEGIITRAHDGAVTFGFMGAGARQISPDTARQVAADLLAAAQRAEQPIYTLYRSTIPPRPGQRAHVVDVHGRAAPHDGSPPRHVSSVRSSATGRPGPDDQPLDEVWLSDGTGPFVRQVGFDSYRLCDAGHRGAGVPARYLAVGSVHDPAYDDG